MKLIELQRRMAADLMRPLTRKDNLSRSAKAAEYVAPNDRLTSRQRLQIYSRSYWYRIFDSLYDDFPGLRAIIGDEAFHKLSRAYLAAHPSRSFTMRNLGSALEQWLQPRRYYTGGNHALALDMVRLEWAHIEAFDGPSAKPLGPEDLLELGPGLRMALRPYISMLEVHYPVDDLRVGLSSIVSMIGFTTGVSSRRRSEFLPRSVAEIVSLNALEAGFKGSQLSIDNYQANIAKRFAVWSELGWLCQPTHL
jgi:hypothetical protein